MGISGVIYQGEKDVPREWPVTELYVFVTPLRPESRTH